MFIERDEIFTFDNSLKYAVLYFDNEETGVTSAILRYSCYHFETMARRLCVEVEGGLYHLIARGNDRQDIFHSHEDRERFLELSLIAGLDTSNISRRNDAAREKLKSDRKLAYARDQVEKLYLANIAESQT